MGAVSPLLESGPASEPPARQLLLAQDKRLGGIACTQPSATEAPAAPHLEEHAQQKH